MGMSLVCTACQTEMQFSDDTASPLVCVKCGAVLDALRVGEPPAAARASAAGPSCVGAPDVTTTKRTTAEALPVTAEAATVAPGAPVTPAPDTEAYAGVAAEATPAFAYSCLAPAQAPDEMGRLGPYRVLRVLGSGGMGIVFLAEDVRLKRQVALKAMLPQQAVKPEARERFLREARTAAAIEHDNIVAILQVDEERGVPYIAMPYLRGTTLESWLRAHQDAMLPLPLVLKLSKQIAMGLAAAHAAGLIHRDIKPANIFLQASAIDPSGRGALSPTSSLLVDFRAKILDFGLARSLAGEQNLTQSGAILGTPAYMAPEQARRDMKVTHRADLFSFGVVLYRLCTGRLPFGGDDMMTTLLATATEEPTSPREINPQLPSALARLVMRLLAKDPNQRPASADEVVERLTGVEARLADTASVPPPIHRPGGVTAETGPAPVSVIAEVEADELPVSVPVEEPVMTARGATARVEAPRRDTLARLVYLLVFGLTLFIASGLLFLLQPMVGKLLTPQLGGTPAVWNTCLIFFQLAVLGGYFYVFVLHIAHGTRIQSLLHLGVAAAAMLTVAAGWPMLTVVAGTNLESSLVMRTFALLVIVLGLPVLVLAATAPLLQRWLAETRLPEAADPYPLYAAGNLGGLLALAVYPVFIEPNLALRDQANCWLIVFGLLVALVLLCLIMAWVAPRRAPAQPLGSSAAPFGEAPQTPRWSTRLWWLICAALPTSLLLGFTSQLTEDLAPAPLFWTVPLAVFLFTIVLGFGPTGIWARLPLSARVGIQCGHALALALTLAVTLMLLGVDIPPAQVAAVVFCALAFLLPYAWVWVLQPIAIAGFFILLGSLSMIGPTSLAWQLFCIFLTMRICHRELARSRPTTPHLTSFYLWIGLGGILGGLFNQLVAPLVFRTSQLEYPLVLLLASAVRPPYLSNGLFDWLATFAIPSSHRARAARWLALAFDLIVPMVLAVVLWVIMGVGIGLARGPFGFNLLRFLGWANIQPNQLALLPQFVYALAMLICLVVVARPLRYALCLTFALILHAGYGDAGRFENSLYVQRTPLGILRVQRSVDMPPFVRPGQPMPREPLEHVLLMHGTTHHGFAYTAPTHRRLATTYYHRAGPLGNALERYNWFGGPTNTYHADARGSAALVGLLAPPTFPPLAPVAAAAFAEPPIAVLGLGTGTIASYARPYQRIDFFELDPTVITFSQSAEPSLQFFHYVQDARTRGAQVNLFAGDARLSLAQRGPDAFYKLIIVDAFASDAIPVHLLTHEAIELYLAKLAPGGIIAVHTSNRHLNLSPMLADTAQSLRLDWLFGAGHADRADAKTPVGLFSSEWLFLARDAADLAPLRQVVSEAPVAWQKTEPSRQRVWTDDFTNLPAVFKDKQFINNFTSVLFALIALLVLIGLAGLLFEALDVLKLDVSPTESPRHNASPTTK
jgi:serine/threonine protein kinase